MMPVDILPQWMLPLAETMVMDTNCKQQSGGGSPTLTTNAQNGLNYLPLIGTSVNVLMRAILCWPKHKPDLVDIIQTGTLS